MKTYVKSTAVIIGAIGMLGTLAGCQTAAQKAAYAEKLVAFKSDPRLGPQVDKICFNIDRFTEASKQSVIVSRGNKDYLIRTSNVCDTLNYAQNIAFDRKGVCTRPLDHIVVSEGFGFGQSDNSMRQRCQIAGIYIWNEDAADEDDNTDES